MKSQLTAGFPGAAGASAPARDFADDLMSALSVRPRRISPKYFYDEAGSLLFDRICELPEYYPTRTEMAMLEWHAAEIATLAGPGAEIVEFGAGSLRKVRVLLQALAAPARYVPIDISAEYLADAAMRLRDAFPSLPIRAVAGDYTQPLALPEAAGPRVGFFPGSTIGNFTPDEALDFLHRAGGILRGGALLLGADLVKDPPILHAAYNDAQGVTAAFNLNLLARANRELGTDFVPAQFAHYAFYNVALQRMEMHLVSRGKQSVAIDGQSFPSRRARAYTRRTRTSSPSTGCARSLCAQASGRTPPRPIPNGCSACTGCRRPADRGQATPQACSFTPATGRACSPRPPTSHGRREAPSCA